ncbi:type II toxin-antitoxin system RelE/ParE family toxin [Duganella sp. FT27W]|uniref:type II toxin-antitoxin system RelE/ParE family toxin n=1 Tax=Duganella sp. FT27W TaxID=2654636 RepID=UPI00128B35B7|nr:type II toxin-antitoxin system RelE/ParE family toxin [Duganella sp. FT27W]MPQ55899.1 type II toxin-antitoxin system mRNA interferase toxin, RelE/StbE family [Duganella sp. FT27W]
MPSSRNTAVRWTRTALANLVAIVEYIEQDSPERAKSFASEIRAQTNKLADFPELGRPGRVPGTRELVVHPHYIIPYRVRGNTIEILRVQHVARRWPRRL